MKACLASWWVALLGATAALCRCAAKSDGGFWDGLPGVVQDCDDFDAEEASIDGAITFLRPLICEKPLMLNVYNTTVVRSHDAINTTNIFFLVHPEATLTLKARVIVMGRDEKSTQPVVQVFGRVKLEAVSWTPSYAGGDLEDNDDLVRVLTGGGIESNQPVHYTTSILVVANDKKVTIDGATVLSKCGRFKWDWLNRLPWERPEDEGYEVHVTEIGMEVRLGERTVWGVSADERMG